MLSEGANEVWKMATWGRHDDKRASYHKLKGEDTVLEQENDRMVSELSSKVTILKSLAIDIDKEAKYQNKFLSGVSDDFESAGGLLGSSFNRLNSLVKSNSGNRKLMCYLVLFLVGCFFLVWYIVGKVKS